MKAIIFAVALFALALTSCNKEDSMTTPLTTALAASDVSEMYTENALPVQTSITHYINANIGGYLEALPAHYNNHPKTRFPVIIFLNGSGSLGNGSKSSLGVEDNIAIPHLIQKGQFPANFTVNGFTYQFIVLTPQFKSWPQSTDVNDMINYAIKTYRINTTKIYICGLSMGGGTAWDYSSAYGKRVAAVVPICGASSPTMQNADSIAKDHLPVWAFHNNGDPTVPCSYSTGWVNDINSYKPAIKAKITIFQNNVHDAWSKATNPDYKENGRNIYEWMLAHSR